MSTLTALLGLIKPDGSDIINVQNFNDNANVLDNAVMLAASQTLTNKTITSPTISAPTITGGATIAGGLTVTTAVLTVTAGGIDNQSAISTSGAAVAGLDNRPSFTVTGGATGVTQRGLYVRPTFTHTENGILYNIHVAANSTGSAGSASGIKYGLSIGAQTGNNFTNYGIAIAAPSGATNNFGLHNDGGAMVNGSGTSLAFYGGVPGTQPTVSGSRGGNAALADLLTELAAIGLIIDSSSA